MGAFEDSQVAYLIFGRIVSLNAILRESLPRVENEHLKKVIQDLLYGEVIALDIAGGTLQAEPRLQEVGEVLTLETIPTQEAEDEPATSNNCPNPPD